MRLYPHPWQRIGVSKDGLTYTYKHVKDAKWYTTDGKIYPVTAGLLTGLEICG